jgi:type II secretory pathway pseudopilin PulG
MIVVLILAILAAVVVLRLGGPLRSQKAADVTGQIYQFDYLTRFYAKQNDQPLRMLFDLSSGRIDRASAQGTTAVGGGLEIPSQFKIASLTLAGRDNSSGNVAISCSRRGLTPSYGILLQDQNGDIKHWLMVCGLTGEVREAANEKEFKDILAMASGYDAR